MFLQGGQCRLRAGLRIFGVKLAYAVQVGRGIGDGLLHFQARGFQQALAGAFFITRLGLFEDRSTLRPQADVALQSLQRLGPAFRRDLLLQQCLLATEHALGGIGPVTLVAVRQGDALQAQVDDVDHDLQVLAHVGIALKLQCQLQLGFLFGQGIAAAFA